MTKIMKKSLVVFGMIMLSLFVATSDVAAGNKISGGGTITVTSITHNFEVKYVDSDGEEIDPDINYLTSRKGTGSVDLEMKEISGYIFEGYYYKNLIETNVQGSKDSLLKNYPAIAHTLNDGKDKDEPTGKISTYTVYMVYAKIDDIQTYTLTYDANGGQGEVAEPELYAENSIVTVLDGNTLSKENYIFKGWNTVEDGSGDAYAPGKEIVLTSDIVLYAQWELLDPNPEEQQDGDKVVEESKVSKEYVDNAKKASRDYPKTGDAQDIASMAVIMIASFIGITIVKRRIKGLN